MMQPILRAQNLSVGYKSALLADQSFDIFPGDFICLMGPNGQGKTTLFKTLFAQQPALNGQVLLSGKNIADYSAKEKSRLMSFVFANSKVDPLLTVEDILMLSRFPHQNLLNSFSSQDQRIVEEVLEVTQLRKLRKQKLGELSDGQRQLAFIARALAQDTAVIFLDEPTNFLDVSHRLEVMRLLRKLAIEKKKAIVFSSHDFELALSSAHWLWVIHQGKLKKGVPEDFILSEMISDIFPDDHLVFDQWRGVFKENKKISQKLSVSLGDHAALTFHWTKHLLSKMGIELYETSSEFADLIVENKKWILKKDTHSLSLNTLEELLNSLKCF